MNAVLFSDTQQLLGWSLVFKTQCLVALGCRGCAEPRDRGAEPGIPLSSHHRPPPPPSPGASALTSMTLPRAV